MIKSKTTAGFWRCYDALPARVQAIAVRSYRSWLDDPRYPGVHFKRVSQKHPLYSARVGIDYRALGLWEGEVVTWIWIGSHADYDNIVSRYR